MREIAGEVCALQKEWEASNTIAMQRRGELIRNELPDWISENMVAVAQKMGVVGNDLFSEGRDGTGQKTEIPWARLASKSRSPSAQIGWYLVYLFEATGEGVYLALSHGSTDFIDGMFRPKAPEDVEHFMTWAKSRLQSETSLYPELSIPIKLNARRTDLGPAYEKTTVLAKWYSADALPHIDEFTDDLILFSTFLRKLYDADDLGQTPNQETPEAQSVLEAIDPKLKLSAKPGQGFGLTADERAAVEECAMERAQEVLEEKGFTVKDVSKTHSYDFLATRDGREVVVEVKGTTSTGTKVILTANEVALHKEKFPENSLIIIHSIELDRDTNPPKAFGGKVFAIFPWEIDDNYLSAIAYSYDVREHLKKKKNQ